MAKRKRDDDDGDISATGAKLQRVQYKLNQSTVKLGHAFKIAKGFERQKLGRRQKNAAKEKDEKASERIENEIAALKTLDTTAAAKHHLYKTLLKIKAVAASDSLGPEVAQVPGIGSEPAVLNVVARLCNSNPAKEVLPGLLEELQRAAGIDVVSTAAGKKKRLRAKDVEAATGKNGKQADARKGNVKLEDIASDDEADSEHSRRFKQDSADSDDEFADFDARLASSGAESEADMDNSDVDDLERQLALEGIARKPHPIKRERYSLTADFSLSDASRSPSLSPEPRKATAPKPKASAFLPSLSMGGYISGGSGSEPDFDIDVAPARKNRRGQRARQQIWEKKFGAKAKHVQNPKEDRSNGWDSKRGATDGGRGGFGKGRGGKVGASRGPRFGVGGARAGYAREAAPLPKKKHNDSEGPLHPSWAAAKAAKEKKEKPAKFEGKKITFD